MFFLPFGAICSILYHHSSIHFPLPGKNPYDMRRLCTYGRLCYDFDMIGTYLNKPEVQTE